MTIGVDPCMVGLDPCACGNVPPPSPATGSTWSATSTPADGSETLPYVVTSCGVFEAAKALDGQIEAFDAERAAQSPAVAAGWTAAWSAWLDNWRAFLARCDRACGVVWADVFGAGTLADTLEARRAQFRQWQAGAPWRSSTPLARPDPAMLPLLSGGASPPWQWLAFAGGGVLLLAVASASTSTGGGARVAALGRSAYRGARSLARRRK